MYFEETPLAVFPDYADHTSLPFYLLLASKVETFPRAL